MIRLDSRFKRHTEDFVSALAQPHDLICGAVRCCVSANRMFRLVYLFNPIQSDCDVIAKKSSNLIHRKRLYNMAKLFLDSRHLLNKSQKKYINNSRQMFRK